MGARLGNHPAPVSNPCEAAQAAGGNRRQEVSNRLRRRRRQLEPPIGLPPGPNCLPARWNGLLHGLQACPGALAGGTCAAGTTGARGRRRWHLPRKARSLVSRTARAAQAFWGFLMPPGGQEQRAGARPRGNKRPPTPATSLAARQAWACLCGDPQGLSPVTPQREGRSSSGASGGGQGGARACRGVIVCCRRAWLVSRKRVRAEMPGAGAWGPTGAPAWRQRCLCGGSTNFVGKQGLTTGPCLRDCFAPAGCTLWLAALACAALRPPPPSLPHARRQV